ncbi:hypothetical protein M422DRAFT_230324 [Sphaerobolus stellatus SS14]|uniref:Glycosyltransferase family 32 protein n=1 Tax=Sphaerobolus stellatus (strain SS14) TaxID=990650 RepID=A0A0C9VPR3_SPHS4|nr:hypothetical protein M422DRAFT_230324 [Sphaerobolus stellatus SS14]
MSSIQISTPINSRFRDKTPRLRQHSPALPIHIHGHDKRHTRRFSWTTPYYVRMPWPLSRRRTGVRGFKIYMPIPTSVTSCVSRLRQGYPRTFRILLAALFILLFLFFRGLILSRRLQATRIVFSNDDIRRVWEWEVASGHYQSSRKIPDSIGLNTPLHNPGLPREPFPPSQNTPISHGSTIGSGLSRIYLDVQTTPPQVAYPPRPKAGSIADLDIIMKHCDFSNNKYVRDCLEVLSVGAGLDNRRRIRRGAIDEWKYIYLEEGQHLTPRSPLPASTTTRHKNDLEPSLHLPPTLSYRTTSELATACDPDHPRIFHIFWGGPFTAHPFTALLSFLNTQNLGLYLPPDTPVNFCRPQFWVWMQMGLAREANPGQDALKHMQENLNSNPWSKPFLHPRFKDIIKFKLWNTTEQLDNVEELKDEWRDLNLFNSGGHVYQVPPANDMSANASWSDRESRDDDVINRVGSTSSKSYDRMRTILSDMARFVLCHRFGGVYLDADTVLLRDWEELWGWKGAFAYRWSRLPLYNTAVLKLNKGSALGTFLIRTALRHGLDFHPMTISQYTKDSGLDSLLLRLPDAVFDPAWLNTEGFQRERPPSPDLTSFTQFFHTPPSKTADAMAIGFDGFFRGAYSYHWHNHWWEPFDSTRNWPDLGPQFAEAERTGRLQAQKAASTSNSKAKPKENADGHDKVSDDKRDLDWATILKRTFEAYIRGEQPNMYGEWIHW